MYSFWLAIVAPNPLEVLLNVVRLLLKQALSASWLSLSFQTCWNAVEQEDWRAAIPVDLVTLDDISF
jgi:hypothetical protein